MQKMNYYQKAINQMLGEACRKARERSNMTQTKLIMDIQELYFKYIMNTCNLTKDEVDKWASENDMSVIPKSVQKEMVKHDITYVIANMSPSTISNYENGSHLIPAYYVYFVMKICGKFEIPHII